MIACGLLLPLLSILAREWRLFLMAREEKIHQTPYDKKAQVDNKGCKLYLCTRLCVALLITPLLLPPPLFLVSSHFSAFYSFFKKHLHPWQCFQSRSSLLHVQVCYQMELCFVVASISGMARKEQNKLYHAYCGSAASSR